MSAGCSTGIGLTPTGSEASCRIDSSLPASTSLAEKAGFSTNDVAGTKSPDGAVNRPRSDPTPMSGGVGVNPSSAGSTQCAAVSTVVGPIITPEHVAREPPEVISTPTVHGQ